MENLHKCVPSVELYIYVTMSWFAALFAECVYPQPDGASIGDSDRPVGHNLGSIVLQIVHTPPQRRRRDVVPEVLRANVVQKQSSWIDPSVCLSVCPFGYLCLSVAGRPPM